MNAAMIYVNLNIRPVEEILREANGRVGEMIGYDLATMNCQHFASEVRNGTSISPE